VVHCGWSACFFSTRSIWARGPSLCFNPEARLPVAPGGRDLWLYLAAAGVCNALVQVVLQVRMELGVVLWLTV